MSGPLLLAAALASTVPGQPAAAAAPTGPNPTVLIRKYEDGPGPTAIFRLGRLEDRHQDLFAIVDPNHWRIQFYALDDWATARGAPDFQARWHERGACALPPTFRLWRVHFFPGSIVLQSQPRVPVDAFVYDRGAKPAALTFGKLRLDGGTAALRAIADSAPVDHRRVPQTACAASEPTASPPFTASDSAARITGGGEHAFTVVRQPAARARAFDARPVELYYKGRWLASAQEIEDGASVNSGEPLRHFLLTTRTAVSGFASSETLLIRKSASGRLDRAMIVNIGLNRVKLGQHPVAVSSKGEVLVLGAPDRAGFRVQRCTFLDVGISPCKVEETELGGAVGDVIPADQTGAAARSAPINWRDVFRYTDRQFSVDTRLLPDACRNLGSSCKVDGITWTPLAELRGPPAVVRKIGFPYGQVSSAPLPPTPAPDESDGLVLTADNQVSVVGKEGTRPHFFGDIWNAGKIMDRSSAYVFGIDCSSFVSRMWHLDSRLDTGTFIIFANQGGKHIGRVAQMGEAHIGDAFVINISDGSTRYINHIVLFREEVVAGPTDSSRGVLVAESNGSCSGTCWTLYDENFFNGWAILRHTDAGNEPAIKEAIPIDATRWHQLFSSPGGAR